MNVLLVVPWDQEVGGIASVVGHLAKYLETRRHEVVFLHPGRTNRLLEKTTKWGFRGFDLLLRSPFNANHPVRSIIAFLGFFLVSMFQVLRLIRKHQIQIVNIHYPMDCFVPFAVCRWLLPVKLVTSVHGADLFPNGERLSRYPWALKLLLISSDAIVAPSRAFAKDFASLFPDLRKRTFFIHNGVDIQELTQQSTTENPGGRERYLLCIAANNEKKALDILIKAFSLLKDEEKAIKLIFVGDGPLRREHEKLAKGLGLSERVLFLGEKGRSEVVSLLRGCELLVLPSRAEPFGIVIPEAMACRKPVVASAVGGIPEIIESGINGILVEPNNPTVLAQTILAILKNHALQEKVANNGYKKVLEFFKYEHTGAKYENLFSDLLE